MKRLSAIPTLLLFAAGALFAADPPQQLLLPACSKKSGTTINVVKPKYHHRWYDRKKDRKTKRTKSVRVRN